MKALNERGGMFVFCVGERNVGLILSPTAPPRSLGEAGSPENFGLWSPLHLLSVPLGPRHFAFLCVPFRFSNAIHLFLFIKCRSLIHLSRASLLSSRNSQSRRGERGKARSRTMENKIRRTPKQVRGWGRGGNRRSLKSFATSGTSLGCPTETPQHPRLAS